MDSPRFAILAVAAFSISPLISSLLAATLGTIPRVAPVIGIGPGDTLTGRRLRPEIATVVIRGAKVIEADDIANTISTTASHCRGILLTPFCLVSKAPYFYERDFLDRDELKRDVLRIRVLYWKRGYRLTSVDTMVAPPGGTKVRVTFTVHEGPPTRLTALSIVPDTIFSDRVRARIVPLRAGQAFDLNALDTGVLKLTQHLWARGFGDATVDTAIRVIGQPLSDSAGRAAAAAGRIGAGTASVTITMRPHARTTVDTVIVNGNTSVSAQTIRHAIVLRPRSLFLRADIERSQRALIQTNLFRRASVAVDSSPGHTDSAKRIIVTVTEARTREADLGVGFTTADFVSATARFNDYNWVGGGRRLSVTGNLGNLFAHGLYSTFNNGYKEIPADIDPNPYLSPTWSVSADVIQPWFLAPENSLGGGVSVHRRIAPGVFIDNGEATNATFTHNVGERIPISLTYRFGVSHVQAGDVYFCVDYGVCDSATRGTLRSRSRLSPLILSGQIDRSNDPLNPTAGFVVRGEIQHASQYTLSDFRYDRAYVYGSLYRPIGAAVLAFNARAGVIHALRGTGAAIGDTSDNVLHPSVRFYAGGAESVRGFGENQLGPQVLTIAPNKLRGPQGQCATTTPIQNCLVNASYLTDADFTPQALGGRTLLEGSVEYRFPIYNRLGGALFVDAGVVGQGNLQSATSGTSAVTPGFGVRYNSVVGPIRVDIGLNPLTTYNLPVLTEGANRQIVTVTGPPDSPSSAAERIYSPARTLPGLQGLLNRFSLHLSIGQAF